MKKKIILTALLLLLAAGAVLTFVMIKKQPEENSNPAEEIVLEENIDPVEEMTFEEKVKALYGERNYLGPMTKEVKPLTEEELKELNPEEEPYVKYSEIGSDVTVVFGRFNKEKIENIQDAREATCRAWMYAGGEFDKDMFLYGEESEMVGGYNEDDYDLWPYYKGIRVKGGGIHVNVDKDGNLHSVYSFLRPEQKITMDSVEYEYKGEKLQALLEERYGECSIVEKELTICRSKTGYVLEWYLLIDAPEAEINSVWLDAKTGEIWREAYDGMDY